MHDAPHWKRSILDPIGPALSFAERWGGLDGGLIASWERGREKAIEAPALAAEAKAGRLVILPFKGGLERAVQGTKYGTFLYLAMWQGLRGEDLNIDTTADVEQKCSLHACKVTFTADSTKYSGAGSV